MKHYIQIQHDLIANIRQLRFLVFIIELSLDVSYEITRHHAPSFKKILIAKTHHRGGSIANLLILQLSKFTEYLGGRMLHLQQLQDGGSIVGDGHVLLG